MIRLGAAAAANSEPPQPNQNSAIMLRRLQWSPSHPAGKENTPKAMKAAVDSAISSP
jgi:hypothetical protein